MPPKRRTSTAPHASKRTRSSNAIAINNAQSAPDIVVSTASRDQLLSLSARELRSQLLAYSLPNSGNKAALADRLYHYFHTSNEVPNDLHCSTTAASLLQPTHGNFSHTDSSIFNPQQFARQLLDLLRHLTPATLQCSGVMQACVTTTEATTTTNNQPPLQALHRCPPVINYLQHFLSLPINKWTTYCLQPLPFSRCHPQLLTTILLCSTVLYLLHCLHFAP